MKKKQGRIDQGTKNIIIIWQKMKQQDMLTNLRRTAKSCTHRAYHYLNQDLKIRILRWQWSQRVHSCFVRNRCNNLSHPRYICLELFIRKTCWFIRATKLSCQLKHSFTFNQAQYKQPVIDAKKKKLNYFSLCFIISDCKQKMKRKYVYESIIRIKTCQCCNH